MLLTNRVSASVTGVFLGAVLGLAPAAAQQPQSLAADPARRRQGLGLAEMPR